MARIVVCESSEELRHLFERTVARLGHEPAACRPPLDGEPTPDAALVDLDEDRIAGEALALHAHAPGLPVIACSIYPRSARSDALAPVAHLVKPFSRAELERAIRDALAGRMGTIAGCPIHSAPTGTSA